MDLTVLIDNPQDSDVVIVTEGAVILAHSLIIKTSSALVRDMIADCGADGVSLRLDLSQYTHEQVMWLLRRMYGASICWPVSKDIAFSAYRLADYLQADSLCEALVKSVSGYFDVSWDFMLVFGLTNYKLLENAVSDMLWGIRDGEASYADMELVFEMRYDDYRKVHTRLLQYVSNYDAEECYIVMSLANAYCMYHEMRGLTMEPAFVELLTEYIEADLGTHSSFMQLLMAVGSPTVAALMEGTELLVEDYDEPLHMIYPCPTTLLMSHHQ